MTAPYTGNPSAAGSFLEGLAGGFQQGYGFRQHRADRKRALEKEEEETAYEKVRRVREAVGFELSQKVQNAQIARADREQQEYTRRQTEIEDRQRRVRESAAAIRAQYSKDPKFKDLTLLPDEELVQQFGGLAANPQRERTARERDAETRQDLSVLNTQVDDARSELSRTEREVPARPMMAEFDPATAARFTADSTAAAGRIGQLRRYMGNLLVRRDSTAAVARGEQFDRREGDALRRLYGVAEEAKATNPADRWEQLVAQGIAPEAATRQVSMEFGLGPIAGPPTRP